MTRGVDLQLFCCLYPSNRLKVYKKAVCVHHFGPFRVCADSHFEFRRHFGLLQVFADNLWEFVRTHIEFVHRSFVIGDMSQYVKFIHKKRDIYRYTCFFLYCYSCLPSPFSLVWFALPSLSTLQAVQQPVTVHIRTVVHLHRGSFDAQLILLWIHYTKLYLKGPVKSKYQNIPFVKKSKQ